LKQVVATADTIEQAALAGKIVLKNDFYFNLFNSFNGRYNNLTFCSVYDERQGTRITEASLSLSNIHC